jgi:dUTP pyrophosphatase
MNLNILKDKGIINNPQNNGDAGYDIVAVSSPRVVGAIYQGLYYTAISHIEYDTEIVIEPEKKNSIYEFYMLLYPRSSIIKTNLSLANSVGVIDSGYRGNIKVCFKYIIQPEDMKIVEGKSFRGKNAKGIVSSVNPQRVYQKGDRIAQLIPCKHNDINIEYVNEINTTERGVGGFGSTGQ